jgi:hypothetical protein
VEILRVEDAFLFDALTDTPICMCFESLYHMFPNSKFIYTVRAIHSWEPSFTAHYQRHHGSWGFDDIKDQLTTRGAVTRGQERAAIYASLYAAHGNANSAYHAYDRTVRRFFSQHDPARLLEMNIAAGNGWATLCPFEALGALGDQSGVA